MACALFAAVSGSSPATVVAIGSIMMPAMVRAGFPKRFGAGVITTSGSLGILIPPSIPMVIYCVATNSSVGGLFMGGVIPGLMLATLLGRWPGGSPARTTIHGRAKATWGERLIAFRESIWGLLLIVIVLGGIYSGMFTPTEAAAMSAVYCLHHRRFRLPRRTVQENPESPAGFSQHVSHAALYHHQRGPVLLPDDP